jgi:hypothetical protein
MVTVGDGDAGVPVNPKAPDVLADAAFVSGKSPLAGTETEFTLLL